MTWDLSIIIINTKINIFSVLQFINLKFIHCWLVKVSWKWLRDSLVMSPVVFASFLLSGMAGYYRLILNIFSPSWKQSFHQGVLVPFREKQYLETTVLVLRVLITTGLVTVSRCFQRTELNTQTHTHIPKNKIQYGFIVIDNCELNSGLQSILHLNHLTSVSFSIVKIPVFNDNTLIARLIYLIPITHYTRSVIVLPQNGYLNTITTSTIIEKSIILSPVLFQHPNHKGGTAH